MRGIRAWTVGLGLAAACAVAAPAPAAEEGVIDEVLSILRDRGLVDEAQYGALVSKNQRYEEEHAGLLGKVEWSGDFRARLENFWYADTALDEDRDNRHRGRYRLRIQGSAEVNDYVDAVFRLASGENDHRSTNRSFGADNDFGPDEIFIDRAYVQLKPPSSWIGESNALNVVVGKTPNPFKWKSGKDYMLWDDDINPEGVGAMFTSEPSDVLTAFMNAGYFVLDENSTSVDPHVLGLQGGVALKVSDVVELGGRLSWYSWHSLNPAFFGRTSASGTLLDGLADDAPGASNDGMDAGELAAYVRFTGLESWPVLVYAHYARNFDAESSALFPAAGEEDTGWGVGVEVGDKKKYVMIGVGYYRLEANFWPAQFTDSDLFDGFTNRKGWTLYGAREILPNTELNVTLFVGDAIRNTIPDFANSVALADRVRLQTDLVVKF